MSTLAYAAVTTRRERATPNTSIWPTATNPANIEAGKPGIGPWLDTATALVPAEVLAAHAFLIQLVTKTTNLAGHSTVTITNVTDAKILFWVLFGLAPLIYLGAHWSAWGKWDFVRMLIPPGAFVLWSALQAGTAFDAVAHWSVFTRYLVGIIGAVALGYIARQLAYKADQAAP